MKRFGDDYGNWLTRITLRHTVRAGVNQIAREECRSIAATIGVLLHEAVMARITAGSSA